MVLTQCEQLISHQAVVCRGDWRRKESRTNKLKQWFVKRKKDPFVEADASVAWWKESRGGQRKETRRSGAKTEEEGEGTNDDDLQKKKGAWEERNERSVRQCSVGLGPKLGALIQH